MKKSIQTRDIMESVTILSTEKNIKKTVKIWMDSLLQQDYPGKFDIVVIDASSTDGTSEILNDYQSRFNNIIKVVEYESTQPQALNYAIKEHLLTGKFVALIDGDCVAPKYWLRTLVKTLKEKGVDAVGGPGLTPRRVTLLQRLIGLDLDARFLSIPEGLVKRHPNMNLLIKREVLEDLKFEEELKVGYDADFGYRFNQKGYKLWYNPAAFVYHYHRASMKSYLKQQFITGKYAFKFYLRTTEGLRGDNINSPSMIFSPVVLTLFLMSLLFSMVNTAFSIAAISLLFILLTLYTLDISRVLKFKKNFLGIFLYLLYFIRTVAWTTGAFVEFIMSMYSHIKRKGV